MKKRSAEQRSAALLERTEQEVPTEADDDELRDLREKIKFDRDALDEAIQEHAGLVLQVGDRYALAVSERDQAKAHMDNEYARACYRARRSGDDKRVEAVVKEKRTEAAVKEVAQLDVDYSLAEQEYLKKKLAADTALSLREAIDARGKMLGKMAELYLSGYFALSSVKGETRRAVNHEAASEARNTLHRARMSRE